ncbi:MAG TPA: hypothetical protein VLH77_01725, partial [Gammaproteobacteria bacterium]|nr:hypothetical protein [Gammaproteobacteria bacterium]
MDKNSGKQGALEEFSLGLGGPFYQILSRLLLLKKPLLLYKRRVLVISMLTWLPLLLLSMLSGLAFTGVKVPFFYDIEVHVRFLLVLSVLLYAEVIAHDRIPVIVGQFLKRNLIAKDDQPKFHRIITSSVYFRGSYLVELALIILVYTAGHWVSMEFLPLKISNWLTQGSNGIMKLAPAGYWYVLVSLPIFQFIVLRWYYRLLIWYRFLWKVSRLPLRLNSLHPDRAGGLGFLTYSLFALGPFLLAHTILLSGMIFNRVWGEGANISEFKMEIAGVLIFVLLLPLIPLLFFVFQMVK